MRSAALILFSALVLPAGSVGAQEAPIIFQVPAARSADVGSVHDIVATYYEAISAPRSKEPDWQRLRSLFMPGARIMTTADLQGGATRLLLLSLGDFINGRDTLTATGYRANEIKRVEERFGAIAQVFSTYESYKEGDANPYARGMNGMQLFHDGTRWWIVSVTSDLERPGVTLPMEYLPGSK